MKSYIWKFFAFTAILLLIQVNCQGQSYGGPGGNVSAEIYAHDNTPHINGTYTYELFVDGSYSDAVWQVSGGTIISQSAYDVQVKWTNASGTITANLSDSDMYGNQYMVGSASLTVSNAEDPLKALNVPTSVICPGTNPFSFTVSNELYFSHGPSGIVARGTEHTITRLTANSSRYTIKGYVGDYPDIKTIQVEVSDQPTLPSLEDKVLYGSSDVTLAVLNPKTGYEYLWYTAATGGAAIYNGASYTFYAAQTVTYYVSSRLFGACESGQRVPVTVRLDLGANVQNLNFVVTTQVFKLGVKSKDELGNLLLDQKAVTYNYLDEFGKMIQTVAKQASPEQKDLVQAVYYDELGFERKRFLPYAEGNDGKYKAAWELEIKNFYGAAGPANIPDDSRYFSEAFLDNTPLFQVKSQQGVGGQWAGRVVEQKNRANTTADAVHRWNLDGTYNATYAEATLAVSELKDEQGNTVFVFMNSLGQKVLDRRQWDGTIGQTQVPFADTYYIYDDLGRVVRSVPPQAVVEMAKIGNYTLTSAISDQWLFGYTYDELGRLIEKKVPGSASVYFVYDALDRPILVQDGNQRQANRWYFTKFDRWNRAVLEGTYVNTTATTRTAMQQLVASTTAVLFEDRAATSHGYTTTQSFPVTATGVDILSVNYYDNYDFNADGQPDSDKQYVAQGLGALEPIVSGQTKGLVTATKKRMLDQNAWLWEVMFYDKKGQLVQTRSNHHKNLGVLEESMTTVYAFSGRVERTVKQHKATATSSVLKINHTFTPDHAGRLKEVKQVNTVGGISNERIVAQYDYNALGQLADKKLHKDGATGKFLQSVDYLYNLRGQLTHINDSGLTGADSDAQADVFGMQLLYEQTQAFAGGTQNIARYDGLVSAVKWQVRATGTNYIAANQMERSYRVVYDKLGRMTGAYFAGNKTGSWSMDVDAFNELLSYDANGNILTLQRNGKKSDGSQGAFDIMNYSYQGQGNQLKSVQDTGLQDLGFLNAANLSVEYTYDTNGNVTSDANKGVTVSYNILNKVEQVTHTASGKYLRYSYSASGTVLTKTEYNGSGNPRITDYLAGFVYTDEGTGSRLDYFGMAEGRVVNTGGIAYTANDLKYEYNITDHLGNVRVAFREEQGLVRVYQESHYYPFGLQIKYIQTNAFQPGSNEQFFNAGSEWEEIFGTYQTFYRHYDPALGRFHAVDPLAEAYTAWTTYQYAYNSPFSYNDPTGAYVKPEESQLVKMAKAMLASISAWGSPWGSATWSPNEGFHTYDEFGKEEGGTLVWFDDFQDGELFVPGHYSVYPGTIGVEVTANKPKVPERTPRDPLSWILKGYNGSDMDRAVSSKVDPVYNSIKEFIKEKFKDRGGLALTMNEGGNNNNVTPTVKVETIDITVLMAYISSLKSSLAMPKFDKSQPAKEAASMLNTVIGIFNSVNDLIDNSNKPDPEVKYRMLNGPGGVIAADSAVYGTDTVYFSPTGVRMYDYEHKWSKSLKKSL